MYGKRSNACPEILHSSAILPSPQGFGPARNIIAFTGGDVTCCPDFYAQSTQLIKEHTRLHVLIETNGFGLTPNNLDILQLAGVDAFWLDIKAYDEETHKWLTGCPNNHILKLPREIINRGFTLEVLSLYIPGVVEEDDLTRIAESLSDVDPYIPFTILAFFPEYQMKAYQSPTVMEMVGSYQAAKSTGLKNIRLGNLGIFIKTESDQAFLVNNVDAGAF
jgi:pyruvate-formate lyase-activating enzyme